MDTKAAQNVERYRQYFSSFDFSRKPPTTPLDQVLAELIAPYAAGSEDGCLALLPVQTGLGKTHSGVALILEQMLEQIRCSLAGEEPPGGQIIIYITDAIDNTRETHDSLIRQIENQQVEGRPRLSPDQQDLLKSRVLYLPSQANQLPACSGEVIRELIERFGSKGARLVTAYARYRQLARLKDEHPDLALALEGPVQDTAGEVYAGLLQAIRKTVRERQTGGLPLTTPDEQALLDQFLPAERLRRGEANVLFMTTSKYLHGCDHVLGKYLPLLDLKGQWLLIDEIDRQNGELLKHLVRQKAVDLIGAVRTLHANLLVQRLDKDPIYSNIASMFDKLAKNIGIFAGTVHIECAFDVKDFELTQMPLSVFSDRTYTHVHSLQHRINRLHYDAAREKNLIRVVPRCNDEAFELGENGFSHFVNRADQLYQSFIQIVQLAVYIRQENARRTGRVDHDQAFLSSLTQQVVSSILNHYNLEGLIEPAMEALRLRSLRGMHKQRPLTERSYHGRGFKYIEVRRHPDSHDTVAALHSGITCSPTGMLAEMVEGGALIIGVSATAEAQTVVHNFDLAYLAQRLGPALRRMDANQRQRLHQYYQQRRAYGDRVRLQVEFCVGREQWLEELLNSVAPVRNPQLELDRLLGVDGDGRHKRLQLAKLMKALEHFARSERNRYLLVLRNGFAGNGQSELQAFINQCLQYWSGERGVQVFHEVNAVALRAKTYDQVRGALQNTLDKVVVFSAYNTMGTGKNPDYQVGLPEDRDSLVWVGEGEGDFSKTDIDALYLEKPTHLLPGDGRQPAAHQLIQFHSVLCLQERSELSLSEARRWISLILQGCSPMVLLNRYHETDDYPAAMRRVIEQAVGRTARTACKREQIQLLADASLAQLLADDDRDPRQLSHEYLALREKARGAHRRSNSGNVEQRRRHNLAQRHTESSRYYIQELLRRLRNPDAQTIADWEVLRRQVLCHPTLDDAPDEYAWLYVQPLSGRGEAYPFEGSPEHSATQMKFFDGLTRANEVSAKRAELYLLMQNDVVRQHFIANGFACEWAASAWLLNPRVFQSIYLGALGEQAARAVLEHHGLSWLSMPEQWFESFDALLEFNGRRALLDVKHWHASRTAELEDQQKWTRKMRTVGSALGVDKVIYLRLFGSNDQPVRFLDDEFRLCTRSRATVLELSGLLDESTGQVLLGNLVEMITWIEGQA